jgi:hypothetical protein
MRWCRHGHCFGRFLISMSGAGWHALSTRRAWLCACSHAHRFAPRRATPGMRRHTHFGSLSISGTGTAKARFLAASRRNFLICPPEESILNDSEPTRGLDLVI